MSLSSSVPLYFIHKEVHYMAYPVSLMQTLHIVKVNISVGVLCTHTDQFLQHIGLNPFYTKNKLFFLLCNMVDIIQLLTV